MDDDALPLQRTKSVKKKKPQPQCPKCQCIVRPSMNDLRQRSKGPRLMWSCPKCLKQLASCCYCGGVAAFELRVLKQHEDICPRRPQVEEVPATPAVTVRSRSWASSAPDSRILERPSSLATLWQKLGRRGPLPSRTTEGAPLTDDEDSETSSSDVEEEPPKDIVVLVRFSQDASTNTKKPGALSFVGEHLDDGIRVAAFVPGPEPRWLCRRGHTETSVDRDALLAAVRTGRADFHWPDSSDSSSSSSDDDDVDLFHFRHHRPTIPSISQDDPVIEDFDDILPPSPPPPPEPILSLDDSIDENLSPDDDGPLPPMPTTTTTTTTTTEPTKKKKRVPILLADDDDDDGGPSRKRNRRFCALERIDYRVAAYKAMHHADANKKNW